MSRQTKVIDLGHGVGMADSTTTPVVHVRSAWYNADDVDEIRFTQEGKNIGTNVSYTPFYETCNAPASPDGITAVGSYISTDGLTYPSAFTDIGSVTDGKRLIRFGVSAKLTSGSTRAFFTWSGRVEYRKK